MLNSATSAGVSIKDDENVQNVVKSVTRRFYDGRDRTRDIKLTPRQDSMLNDYKTERGQRFRDSLQSKFPFNAYQ